MYRLSFSIIVLLTSVSTIHAQLIRKERAKIDGKAYSYQVMNSSQPVKGIVLLMPSRAEEPKEVFWHTAIPKHLGARGFITIVPSVDYALILAEETKRILNDMVAIESARIGSPAPFFIGGFSSGGAIAARYAEYLLSEQGDGAVQGLFLIDPPLDLARLYNAWTRLADSDCPQAIISESEFIRQYVEKVTGGTPDERQDIYVKLSAFTATDSLGGNAQSLKNVPMRLYSEPDLKAMQEKYCADLTDQNLNSSDLEAFAARLKELGNRNVEYIKTHGRGGHSWNIVAPEDLARWVASWAVGK